MPQLIINPFEILEQRLNNIESALSELRKDIAQPRSIAESDDDIGDMDLAIKVTRLAKPTIYALVAQEKIPYMKRSKKLYFSRKLLLDWIKKGRSDENNEGNSKTNGILIAKKSRTIR